MRRLEPGGARQSKQLCAAQPERRDGDLIGARLVRVGGTVRASGKATGRGRGTGRGRARVRARVRRAPRVVRG